MYQLLQISGILVLECVSIAATVCSNDLTIIVYRTYGMKWHFEMR